MKKKGKLGQPASTLISENIGLGYLPTPLPAPKTLSDAESSGDLSFRSLNIFYKLCLRQRAKRRESVQEQDVEPVPPTEDEVK